MGAKRSFATGGGKAPSMLTGGLRTEDGIGVIINEIEGKY